MNISKKLLLLMLERLFEYGYKSYADLRDNFSEKALLEFSRKQFEPDVDDIYLQQEDFVYLFNIAFECGLNNSIEQKIDLCSEILRKNSYFFQKSTRHTKLVNKNEDAFMWNKYGSLNDGVPLYYTSPSVTTNFDISNTYASSSASASYFINQINPWLVSNR